MADPGAETPEVALVKRVLTPDEFAIFEGTRWLIGIHNEQGTPTLMGIIVRLARQVELDRAIRRTHKKYRRLFQRLADEGD